MPLIMTKNAIVTCPHGGTGTNIPTQNKVFVKDSPVMVDGDSGSVLGCMLPLTMGLPCKSYQLNSMKLNSTYIDGKNIMLITDYVLSDTGYPLIISETHFVEDNTTPAPLKPGEEPSFPPFLLNLIKPQVQIAPPSSYKYSISGVSGLSKPPPLTPFVFTLMSTFPLKWKLTELLQPDVIKDLTDNNMVTIMMGGKKGGEWNDNILKANLKIPKTEILSIGKYYFTMTAIDQRGNADYANAEIKVIA